MGRPDDKQNCCGTGKNVNVRSSAGEEVRHLSCGVMCLACSCYLMHSCNDKVRNDYLIIKTKHNYLMNQ